ncbi:hypothetical protein CQ020_13845 [Arthrobacter sp. MYb23]|uniref:hypothetical protein n=1 Tax=unclassified Arthrobacter TaxID=235627 RepID=UPI000CFAB282|nr:MULTISPECIES: hypothetical protein [unclassified Arthrobacter]PRB40925.1 hypothetical protein CQ038_15575 [Arthrobacter sp. MYb51]PRB94991.1 hypothetical protein CQ020_13845 [Arthrobacter sp. MYb23]
MKYSKVKAGLIAGAAFLVGQFIYQVVLTAPYSLGISLVMAVIVVVGSVVGRHVMNRRRSGLTGDV